MYFSRKSFCGVFAYFEFLNVFYDRCEWVPPTFETILADEKNKNLSHRVSNCNSNNLVLSSKLRLNTIRDESEDSPSF